MKQVSILGGGESGLGAALLAQRNGMKPFVSDYGVIKDNYKDVLLKNKIEFEENGHTFEKLLLSDIVVKSPGIPEKAKVIVRLRQKEVRIISEIEFAYPFCQGKILAITGSNGKTTTSLLTYHILKSAGKSVTLCGNIGNSFAGELALSSRKDIYVIEVSSFQLDDIELFKADISILLNISPDHLDRYNYNYDEYVSSKCRIVNNQGQGDLFITNRNDSTIKKCLSILNKGQRRIEVDEANLLETSSSVKFSSDKFSLTGKHNYFNAKCSIEACTDIGLSHDEIQRGLNTFRNHPHRMEKVACIDGVIFINDSKATNVDSVYYALDSIDNAIVWIVGGVDKGNDYSQIIDLVEEKVETVICLGVDNEKLKEQFSNKQNIETQSMDEAVKKGFEKANRGSIVLLSPACASFDLFSNYKDRGDQFKRSVWGLL